MWSGFSSEIETGAGRGGGPLCFWVACGAASHLRLKPPDRAARGEDCLGRMWSGFSSEIETSGRDRRRQVTRRRMWSGFSSEIETRRSRPAAACLRRVACGAASHLRLKHNDTHRYPV